MYIGEFGDYFYLLNCYGNNTKTVAEVDDFSKKIISSFKIIKSCQAASLINNHKNKLNLILMLHKLVRNILFRVKKPKYLAIAYFFSMTYCVHLLL